MLRIQFQILLCTLLVALTHSGILAAVIPIDRILQKAVTPADTTAAVFLAHPGREKPSSSSLSDLSKRNATEGTDAKGRVVNQHKFLQAAAAKVTPGFSKHGHRARRDGVENSNFPTVAKLATSTSASTTTKAASSSAAKSSSSASTKKSSTTTSSSSSSSRSSSSAAPTATTTKKAKVCKAKTTTTKAPGTTAKIVSVSSTAKSSSTSASGKVVLGTAQAAPTTAKATSSAAKSTSTTAKTTSTTAKASSSTAKASSSTAKATSTSASAATTTTAKASSSSTAKATSSAAATTTTAKASASTTSTSTAAASTTTSSASAYGTSEAMSDLKKIMSWAGASDAMSTAEQSETVYALLSAANRYFPDIPTQTTVRYLLADINAESSFNATAWNGGRLDSGASLGLMQVSPSAGAQELPLWQGHARVSANTFSWQTAAGPGGVLTDPLTGQQMLLSNLTTDDLFRPWINIHIGAWAQSNLGRTAGCDPWYWESIAAAASAARVAEATYSSAKSTSSYAAMTSAQQKETTSLVCASASVSRSVLTGLGSWVAGATTNGDDSYGGSGDDVSKPYFANIANGLRVLTGNSTLDSSYLDALTLTPGLVDYRQSS